MGYVLLLIFGLFAFAMAGCERDPREAPVDISMSCDVPEADKDKFLKFVVDCSAAANPKSDEEGEDLVAQCQQTGKSVLQVCAATYKVMADRENWVDCSTSLLPTVQEACKKAGWKKPEKEQ